MAQESLDWASRIEIVSDQYKNATITLIDPSLVETSYDPVTGTISQTGDGEVWSGAARIQPVRMAVDVGAQASSNPTGEVRVRVQIPRTALTDKIKRGWLVRVTAAERNPQLLEMQLVVDASVNSSWRASITVECVVDTDVTPSWSA